MGAFLPIAKARFSIRRFEQRPVAQEQINRILEAAQAAPTAKNLQGWKVLVLTQSESLEQLKDCTPCHYHAPLAFVVCANHDVHYTREYDQASSEVIDASIAATHMMLEAWDQGIGSTWVMNFKPKAIQETYNIPDNLEPVALLVCGYPIPGTKPSGLHGSRKAVSELTVYEKF